MRTFLLLTALALAACGSDVTNPGSGGAGGSSGTSSATGGTGGGGSVPAGTLGATCASNADCDSGICLDISTFDSGCTGKICTQTCQSNADCPATFDGPDCDSSFGQPLCLYGAWATLYCGK